MGVVQVTNFMWQKRNVEWVVFLPYFEEIQKITVFGQSFVDSVAGGHMRRNN